LAVLWPNEVEGPAVAYALAYAVAFAVAYAVAFAVAFSPHHKNAVTDPSHLPHSI
jgi:hypothetical protein